MDCNSPTMPLLLWNKKNGGLNRDGNRSAFSPYRPSTVLTNLQRGNVQTENTSEFRERGTHELAGQGELFWGDMRFDENFDYSFDPNRADKNGLTPLMWAASYGQRATVKKLISLGADINTVGDHGETALILAASAGHAAVVKELLKIFTTAIDYRDEDGNTALFYAAYNNHAECVKYLLSAGADCTVVNECGENVFDILNQRRSRDAQAAVQEYLVDAVKTEYKVDIDVPDECQKLYLLSSIVPN